MSGIDEIVMCFPVEIQDSEELWISETDFGKLKAERDRLQAELAALRATHPAPDAEPVAFIPVDRVTGEQWTPTTRKGNGVICDYLPLYLNPAATVPAGSRVVPVELLELIATHLEWDGSEPMTTIEYAYKCDGLAAELRALLEVKP